MRNKEKRKELLVLKELLTYVYPYKFYLVISILSALLSVLFLLLFPYLTGLAIDQIENGSWISFFETLIFMVFSASCSAIFQFVLNLSNNKMAYSISRDLRKIAFSRLQTLPLKYLDSHSQGEIVSRIISDTDNITEGLLMGFSQLFTGVLTILGTLVFLFYINWIIALVVLLVTPLSLFTASFIAKHTFSLFRDQNKKRGEETAYIDEMIPALDVIQLYQAEKRSEDTFDTINDSWALSSKKATFFSSLTNPTTRFVNAIVYLGVALSGALASLFGSFSIGALSASLTYSSQYTKPFNEISGVMTELQNALSSAERVFSLIREKSEKADSSSAIKIKAEGNVDVKNVFFSYVENKKLIEDLTFSAKKGMKVALVGPTGCGKTTIINLLMRFYEINSGEILVDGIDQTLINKASLRSNYGMVLQDTWIKEGTLWDNLVYARPNATKEEVDKVVSLCHLDQFVATLENGYEEIISDEVTTISQGQKQLICIARVMLSEPRMLILDEATSSIDTRTEMIIQNAFSLLMEGKTSFIVAHRLSTIKKADLILVMKDGVIIEKGKHDELLTLGGFYNKLYNSQFNS